VTAAAGTARREEGQPRGNPGRGSLAPDGERKCSLPRRNPPQHARYPSRPRAGTCRFDDADRRRGDPVRRVASADGKRRCRADAPRRRCCPKGNRPPHGPLAEACPWDRARRAHRHLPASRELAYALVRPAGCGMAGGMPQWCRTVASSPCRRVRGLPARGDRMDDTTSPGRHRRCTPQVPCAADAPAADDARARPRPRR
jgi:hypothetical protein